MSEFTTTAAKQYLQWDRDKFVARIAALEAQNKALREAGKHLWDKLAEHRGAGQYHYTIENAMMDMAHALAKTKGEKP